MMTVKVSIKNASLQYPIEINNANSLRSAIESLFSVSSAQRVPLRTVDALRDISIELKEGDSLGLIGGNGAGKSTLLRMIAGIYKPSEGQVSVHGDISTLFDLWCGMDETADAFTNIRILSSTLGFTARQEKKIREDIVDVTGLGDALYRPVYTYSAGMRVRFVFSVVSAFFSDILLLDEIIGVGDKAFMEKSREKIKQGTKNSKIVVVASHSDDVLKDFCNLGAVLHKGRIHFYGPIKEALAFYNSGGVNG